MFTPYLKIYLKKCMQHICWHVENVFEDVFTPCLNYAIFEKCLHHIKRLIHTFLKICLHHFWKNINVMLEDMIISCLKTCSHNVWRNYTKFWRHINFMLILYNLMNLCTNFVLVLLTMGATNILHNIFTLEGGAIFLF